MKSEQAQAAQLIRKELRAKFIHTIFSVTSEGFAGGNAVRISWLNGPTSDMVRDITAKYEQGTFDGMTDSYNYDNSRDDIPQVKYITSNRNVSAGVKEEIKISIAKDYGIVNIDDEQEWMKKTGMWSDQKIYTTLRDKVLK